MKKFLALSVVLFMLMISMPLSAEAQNQFNRKVNKREKRVNYDNRRYERNRNYRSNYNRRPSFYQRNRNLINIAAGTGAGALIGGIIGGNKKGVLIGAAIGAGSSALYTYKINPKKKRYYRR